ncbi:type IV secretion system protein [Bisgaard Taxon 10/6]|uniref:type IV secretion system protein n=1 Tax=Exercitatus varius TaxID=67857 RepID=UPI00294AA8CC|nr:type IV secretion system protein [Exercitatus varius]MDG2957047.1 type IV secretion system protein [Exercitatus varius]MDG2965265.1 type IV secretion system protein [Exercitatus varius]
MSSFVSTLYTEIVTAVSSQTATMAGNFATGVRPVYVAFVGLYVVYVIYKINNQGGVVLMDILNQVALITLVGAFSFGASKYYYNDVIPFVQNAGDELAQAIAGKNSTATSTTTIDTIISLFNKQLVDVYKEWEKLGITDGLAPVLNVGLKIAFLESSKFIFSIAVAVNLLIAKIMVNLLLSVGVLFVGFALFPSTRNMFQSFTGLCFNYILLNVLYSAAVVMVAKFLEARLGVATGSDYLNIFVAVLIIVFALNQIPTLVSSLTGGVGISPFTAGGMFGAAAGLARMGLRGAGGLLGRDGAARNFLQGKRSAAQKGAGTDSLPKRWKKRIEAVKNIGKGKAGA